MSGWAYATRAAGQPVHRQKGNASVAAVLLLRGVSVLGEGKQLGKKNVCIAVLGVSAKELVVWEQKAATTLQFRHLLQNNTN